MKRIFTSIVVTVFSVFSLVFIMPVTTAGALTSVECKDHADTAQAKFLDFPTWYRGFPLEVNASRDACVLAEDAFKDEEIGLIILKIALNVVDIILRLVGIIAVGFVIWGGFQYIISRGEPEHTKSAIITIRNAVVGMVIAMVAAIVVSFIVSRLGA